MSSRARSSLCRSSGKENRARGRVNHATARFGTSHLARKPPRAQDLPFVAAAARRIELAAASTTRQRASALATSRASHLARKIFPSSQQRQGESSSRPRQPRDSASAQATSRASHLARKIFPLRRRRPRTSPCLNVSPPGFWRRRIPRVVSAGRRDCVRVDHDSCLRVNNDGYVRVDDDAVCICLTRPPERIQTPRKRRGI